jgi:hypothetical protein
MLEGFIQQCAGDAGDVLKYILKEQTSFLCVLTPLSATYRVELNVYL